MFWSRNVIRAGFEFWSNPTRSFNDALMSWISHTSLFSLKDSFVYRHVTMERGLQAREAISKLYRYRVIWEERCRREKDRATWWALSSHRFIIRSDLSRFCFQLATSCRSAQRIRSRSAITADGLIAPSQRCILASCVWSRSGSAAAVHRASLARPRPALCARYVVKSFF